MIELLNNLKYHLYDYTNFYGSQHYTFVFPLDLHNIKDIEIVIPDILKMNNRSMIRNYVYVERYELKLKYGQMINFQQLDDSDRKTKTPFAHGYACFYFPFR